jgi:hypothetical protein
MLPTPHALSDISFAQSFLGPQLPIDLPALESYHAHPIPFEGSVR